jgi:hypothetical protein
MMSGIGTLQASRSGIASLIWVHGSFSSRGCLPAGAVPPEFSLIDRKRALGSIAGDDWLCPFSAIAQADVEGSGGAEGGHPITRKRVPGDA